MATRAKFTCVEIGKTKGWKAEHPFLYSAKLQAVSDTSEENKKFFAATPNGNITLSTVTEDVFEVGKSYYVDFTEAE